MDVKFFDKAGPKNLDRGVSDSLAFTSGREDGLEREQEHVTKEAAQSCAGIQSTVALAAMKGDRTSAEMAQQYDLHPNQITDWKTQLLKRTAQVFDGLAPEPGPDLNLLHAKIGQLTLENDFWKVGLARYFPATTSDGRIRPSTAHRPTRRISTTCRKPGRRRPPITGGDRRGG